MRPRTLARQSMLVMVVGGKTPVVKIAELERLGFAVELRFTKV